MCNTVKVARHSQNSRWPTSMKDIMPHGGKVTTQAFLRWAVYAEDMAFTAFGVLGHMVKICGSLIIGDITANTGVGEIFVSTSSVVQPHDDSESYHDRLAVAQNSASVPHTPRLSSTLRRPLLPKYSPSSSQPEKRKWCRPFEFFDWAIVSSLARQILVDHPELQPQLTELHADIVVARRMIEDPLHTVHRVLADAKSRTRCHAQGCPQSLASTGTEFKRCSACRVVAYCGKACQTRAWKTGPHAHKHICAQIKALIAKGGGLDDRDVFVKKCREASVSADEALKVAKWDFNPGMTASKLEGRPVANIDSDGEAEFNEMFWQLNPDKHPQAAERWERMRSYWESDKVVRAAPTPTI
ncbi:hypothetical protein GGX14DRAFT_634563 [Mycena pura]|uniref:MYND-type domain-containing protein n=1 Tax=Mycena pura TaxID=153505 RepID=A0AAD6YDV5_9AGAR|nr:hypothetical protein GGX14DRAFT_634563 [Mycena pura]